MCDKLKVSERRICRVLGQHRSTQRHGPNFKYASLALRADPDIVLASVLRCASEPFCLDPEVVKAAARAHGQKEKREI